MKKIIKVFYASSRLYLPMASVSIISMMNQISSDRKVLIYFLYTDIDIRERERLQEEVCAKGHEIVFINGKTILDIMKRYGILQYHGNYMNLVKVFMSSILPDEDDRIFWIDCDTVINDSIEEIFQISLQDKPIAMCCDTMRKKYKKQFGINADEPYYNSGIVLFDLKQWRKRRCEERIVNHIETARSKYVLAEQDIFNIVLKQDILTLPCKFNVITPMIMHDYQQIKFVYGLNEKNFYTQKEFELAKETPVIIHFAGDGYGRPWFKDSNHPYKYLFEKIITETNLFDYEDWNKKIPLQYRIQRWAKKNLPPNVFKYISLLINWTIENVLYMRSIKEEEDSEKFRK